MLAASRTLRIKTMIKTVIIDSWNDFANSIAEVRSQYMVHQFKSGDTIVHEQPNLILFRGQSNETWKLETTLERRTKEQFSVLEYFRLAGRCASEIESFTDTNWNLKPYNKIEDTLNREVDPARVSLPHYDYLVYLRHHGFPSPLLDWTESPYIAAFFAYSTAEEDNPVVYCYIERPELIKGGSVGDPTLQIMGPYVRTHKRHFSQKARYTVSTIFSSSEEKHYFTPHENVFSKKDDSQDLLIKIILPSKDRKEALFSLNDYNINYFTLFQSEDSLIKSLEMKEFDLKGKLA